MGNILNCLPVPDFVGVDDESCLDHRTQHPGNCVSESQEGVCPTTPSREPLPPSVWYFIRRRKAMQKKKQISRLRVFKNPFRSTTPLLPQKVVYALSRATTSCVSQPYRRQRRRHTSKRQHLRRKIFLKLSSFVKHVRPQDQMLRGGIRYAPRRTIGKRFCRNCFAYQPLMSFTSDDEWDMCNTCKQDHYRRDIAADPYCKYGIYWEVKQQQKSVATEFDMREHMCSTIVETMPYYMRAEYVEGTMSAVEVCKKFGIDVSRIALSKNSRKNARKKRNKKARLGN